MGKLNISCARRRTRRRALFADNRLIDGFLRFLCGQKSFPKGKAPKIKREVSSLFYDIETRVIKEAEFVLKENATVRSAAKVFGVSKSTVHYDLTKRLKDIDGDMCERVKGVLFTNLSERHIRGGVATRNKFKKQRGK